MTRPRPLDLSALLIVGTVTIGLILRLVPLGLSGVVVKHGGSVLWASMVYWIVSTLRGHWSPRRAIAAATITAFAVELTQLHHDPLLDAFRATRGGALLLGRVFLVGDLVVYGSTIMIVGMIDRLVRKRSDHRPRGRLH